MCVCVLVRVRSCVCWHTREHSGSQGRMHVCKHVHGNAYMLVPYVRLCVCSTETVSKTTRLLQVQAQNIWLAHFKRSEKQEGWGKATAEGRATVIKLWRPWGAGWGPGLHHYSIHLLLACLSGRKPVFFHYVLIQHSGHPYKTTTRLKRQTSGANRDHNGSSAMEGEYQITDLDVFFQGLGQSVVMAQHF